MMKQMTMAAASLLAFASAAQAGAETVTFEGLSPNATYASPLTVSGLTFTNPGIGAGDEFFAIAPGSNGTLTLAPNYFGSTTTVSSTGLFTLTSIDLSDAFDFADDPLVVDFTFNTTGGTLTRSVEIDFTPGMQTELFNISGITSFSFVTSGSFFGEDTVQIDNIVYDLAAGGGVPEPASWALMIAGIGAAGGALRRRRAVSMKVSFA